MSGIEQRPNQRQQLTLKQLLSFHPGSDYPDQVENNRPNSGLPPEELRQWQTDNGFPPNISYTEIQLRRSNPVYITNLSLMCSAAIAGLTLSGSDTRDSTATSKSSGRLLNDPTQRESNRLSRRDFIKLAFAGSGALVASACTRPPLGRSGDPTGGEYSPTPPPPRPTPTLDFRRDTTGELASYIESDTRGKGYKDQSDWIRHTFQAMADSLDAQFDQTTISRMRLLPSGLYDTSAGQKRLIGMGIELWGDESGNEKYLYFGSNEYGNNGAWVLVPKEAEISTDANDVQTFINLFPGSNVGQPEYVKKYSDTVGYFMHPGIGMMTGIFVPRGELVSVQTSLLGPLAAGLSGLVRKEVVDNHDTKAQFTLALKKGFDEKRKQYFYYAVVEHIKGDGSRFYYLVDERQTVIPNPIENRSYRLDKMTGDLISEVDDRQGAVEIGRNPGGTLVVEPLVRATVTPVASPTSSPTPTPPSTATIEVTRTPTLILTPRPTEKPTATEIPKPPPLRVEGAKFMEGDKHIIMTGAVTQKFVIQEITKAPDTALIHAKQEIDAMVNLGADFVVIEWNSGMEYLGQSKYVAYLIEAIKYAKNRGLRVELVLHSRGLKSESSWENQQITVLNKQIVADWQKLLSDPKVASDLSNYVDIFGVLAEAMSYTHADNPILWEAANVIKNGLNNPNAICTFSLGEWGGDARELLNVSPQIIDRFKKEGIVVEIHPYVSYGNQTGFDYIEKLQELGLPVMIGEMGDLPWDPQDGSTLAYNKKLLDFIRANGLSFAWFAVDVTSPYPNHIYNKNGITNYGKLVRQYFINYVNN